MQAAYCKNVSETARRYIFVCSVVNRALIAKQKCLTDSRRVRVVVYIQQLLYCHLNVERKSGLSLAQLNNAVRICEIPYFLCAVRYVIAVKFLMRITCKLTRQSYNVARVEIRLKLTVNIHERLILQNFSVAAYIGNIKFCSAVFNNYFTCNRSGKLAVIVFYTVRVVNGIGRGYSRQTHKQSKRNIKIFSHSFNE